MDLLELDRADDSDSDDEYDIVSFNGVKYVRDSQEYTEVLFYSDKFQELAGDAIAKIEKIGFTRPIRVEVSARTIYACVQSWADKSQHAHIILTASGAKIVMGDIRSHEHQTLEEFINENADYIEIVRWAGDHDELAARVAEVTAQITERYHT